MLTQLDPPLPLEVEDKGKGFAIAVIDYGPEHHLVWVTALDENGEIWCAPNPRVRLQGNWTMGRRTRRSDSATRGSTGATAEDRHPLASDARQC